MSRSVVSQLDTAPFESPALISVGRGFRLRPRSGLGSLVAGSAARFVGCDRAVVVRGIFTARLVDRVPFLIIN
jgi:hypothetical protein